MFMVLYRYVVGSKQEQLKVRKLEGLESSVITEKQKCKNGSWPDMSDDMNVCNLETLDCFPVQHFIPHEVNAA